MDGQSGAGPALPHTSPPIMAKGGNTTRTGFARPGTFPVSELPPPAEGLLPRGGAWGHGPFSSDSGTVTPELECARTSSKSPSHLTTPHSSQRGAGRAQPPRPEATDSCEGLVPQTPPGAAPTGHSAPG